jgi:hypothetical protein
MDLFLTDIHGKETEKASFSQIKEAYLELFRHKGYGKLHINILDSLNELELEIYSQSVILIDQCQYIYDGPGCEAERLSMRYEEGSILPILEELCNLLYDGVGEEKIIKLLKTLPKPKGE